MNKKEYSSKQEKMIADYLEWHQVVGSGARPTFTGDVEGLDWLGECKTHVSPGHKILFDINVFDKIVKEASAKFKQPAYFVDDGSQKISKTWVVCLDRDLSSNYTVEPYPLKHNSSKNLIFDHEELKSYLPEMGLFRLKLGQYNILLTSLEFFYYTL